MEKKIEERTHRKSQGQHENRRISRTRCFHESGHKIFEEIILIKHTQEEKSQNDSCDHRSNIHQERLCCFPFCIKRTHKKEGETLSKRRNNKECKRSSRQSRVRPREFSGAQNSSNDLCSQHNKKNGKWNSPKNNVTCGRYHFLSKHMSIFFTKQSCKNRKSC